MDNLIEFYRSKMVRTGNTPYLTIPKITKEKYGITAKNAKQFHVRYFHSYDSDDIIIRIEKLPPVGEFLQKEREK